MLDMLALPDDGQLSYDRHVPAVLALLERLPAGTKPARGAVFKGGAMLKCSPSYYVAVLLPPTRSAHENMATYLVDHFDGEWETVGHEFYGEVEAVHLMAPWA